MNIAWFTSAASDLMTEFVSSRISDKVRLIDFSGERSLRCEAKAIGAEYHPFDSWDNFNIPQPDIIFSYRLPVKLPSSVISECRFGAFNIHPSLLPEYPGANPWFQMYLDMAQEGGVTVHSMSDNFDAGNILLQEKFAIEPGERLPIAIRKSEKLALRMLKRFMDENVYLQDGVPQDSVSGPPFHITFEEILKLPAERLWHLLRGFPMLIPELFPGLPHNCFEAGEYSVCVNDVSSAKIICKERNLRQIECPGGVISLYSRN